MAVEVLQKYMLSAAVRTLGAYIEDLINYYVILEDSLLKQ